MLVTADDLRNMGRIERLNLVNALSGIKPVQLIGTRSRDGADNLAIFNSVVHIGSNPPLLGFILRPDQSHRRDTFSNLSESGFFTLNHVHRTFLRQAHYTSAKFPEGQSEFEACELTPQWIGDFPAPFVAESKLKIGLEYKQQIPIEINGTSLVLGQVVMIDLPEYVIEEEGHLNLSLIGDVGISGLNTYYSVEKIARLPYARPDKIPSFTNDSDIAS